MLLYLYRLKYMHDVSRMTIYFLVLIQRLYTHLYREIFNCEYIH